MAKTLTITLPDDLDQALTEAAHQTNQTAEDLVLDLLCQELRSQSEEFPEEFDPDDTPTEVVLQGLKRALEDVKAGRVYPIDELWKSIDD
jgi:predicted transcriptional regulator